MSECHCGCCSCEHEHEHEHEHSSDKNGIKGDIIKIIVTAVLFVAAVVVTKVFWFSAPVNIIIFALPYLVIGYEVLFGAAKNIVKGKIFNESFLMSVATLGAFAIGEYPEAVFVMLFFAVGELCEHIAEGKSRSSIKKLMDIRPDKANLYKDGEIVVVSPEEVNVGDIILVSAGERIALDGVIVEGDTTIDTSAITGESLPLEANIGDKVYSGCVNLSGVIKVRVTEGFYQSTASKILTLAQEASEKRAKVDRFITKFARIYTPAVVAAAILMAVLPCVFWGFNVRYIKSALTFLVVSCPCAIVVSVPLTFFGGIGCSSRHGILIKGADALEKLCDIKRLVFDKTGTITQGRFEVVAVHPQIIAERQLLAMAAAAERYSNHPISLSIKNAAEKSDDELNVSDVEEISGFGVKALINEKTVVVGNDSLMQRFGISYRECHKIGTVVHVGYDNEYYGHIVISDVIKPDSKEAIANLKGMGIKTYMLTGDNEAVAEGIAKEIGVDRYFAKLLPENKVSHLETLMNTAKNGEICAFVGDGINDAPVLSRADLGIAMGALGSDAAIEAADVVLMDDNLKRIPLAIKIAKRTKAIAIQNIAFSLLVKFTVLLLSAMGVSQIMWFAAFADAGVLVLAVLNAVRALRYRQ